MLVFQNIQSTRTVVASKEVEVIATSTPGEFKITPLAAEKIGIEAGDFVTAVVLGDDVYIAKGKTGIAVTDADGNQIIDARNRKVYEEGTCYGSLARPASETNATLRTTSTGAWKHLGASEDVNKVFSLEEGVEGTVPVSSAKDAEMHTTTFYKLTFKKDVAKQERKANATSDVDASNIEVNDEAELEDAIWNEEA